MTDPLEFIEQYQPLDKDLTGFFKPKTIAVIGASPKPNKIGHMIFQNIIRGGYDGTVIPIHPTAQYVLGHKAYVSIKDIPDDIDLAIIAIPAPKVLEAYKECADKKVK